jgi:spore coat polysaccharide biosynthesis protein SpsF
MERLSDSGFKTIVATTQSKNDDRIYDYCQDRGWNVFRGSETDVLSRYYHCAKEFNLDIIVRVTSDCPLVDGFIIREGIEQFLQEDSMDTYLSNCHERTFPRGFDFEVFSFQRLSEAYHQATDLSDREHVTPFIYFNRDGKTVHRDFLNPRGDFQSYRITVDEVEDFHLIQKLILDFDAHKKNYSERILKGITEMI